MKGRKKQLLGLVGLAFVFAMTAIAYSLPAPDAAAADVNISVEVRSGKSRARIISPAPGQVLMSPTGRDRSATVSINQEELESLSTSLKCEKADGEQVFNETKTRDRAELQDASSVVGEVFEFDDDLDLNNLSCQVSIEGRGLDGLIHPDEVSFSFRAMNIPNPGTEEDPNDPDDSCEEEVCPVVDEEGNPVVEVNVNEDVVQVSVQVYDMDGNPVFVDENGDPTPLLTTKDAFKDGKVTITLPMSKYNAKPGKYVAIFTGTNSKGEVVSVNEYWFEYMPRVETPGTGSIFKDLNLSRADYLITGLFAFGAVAGFAVYLVFRKSRR